ncbi:MAG TPA: hypothetical protein VNO30_23425 [Kofleriaceae bacterium]|nr:hypothetical protein [Kofleriaceae bacterium]
MTSLLTRMVLGGAAALALIASAPDRVEARPVSADAAEKIAPKVFPLIVTSRLPSELTGTPEALTNALATLLGGEITERPLEELGKALRCDIEISTCLDRVARSLATNQLVYGTLLVTVDGKVRVKLVRFDSAKGGSEMFQRTFMLSAKTPRKLGKQLARAAGKMFGREVTEPKEPIAPAQPPAPPPPSPPPPTPPKPAEPTESAEPSEPSEPSEESEQTPAPAPAPVIPPPTEPKPEPARTADDPSRGQITKGTWAIIGAGAAIAAGGSGLLYWARDLRDQSRTASLEMPDDPSRAADLEDRAKLRDRLGTALAMSGGVILVVGVMRGFAQRDRDHQSAKPSPSLSLVPVSGGAAVVFSGNLR